MLIAFPLQQWLREFAWMSRYTHIANLVNRAFLQQCFRYYGPQKTAACLEVLMTTKNFPAGLHDQLCHWLICSSFCGHFVSPNSQRLHSKMLKEGVARKYRGKKELHRSPSHYTDIKAIKKKNLTRALSIHVVNLMFIGPCIAIYFYSKSNKMQQLLKFNLFLG
jgi:hypothetical protein